MGQIKAHVCSVGNSCICSITALEPDEFCPIHSGVSQWSENCHICGRFFKHPKQPEMEPEEPDDNAVGKRI